jgi:hypothetical protein
MSRPQTRSEATARHRFAAYMASVFASGARGCAHEVAFIEARIRVMAELGTAKPADARKAARMTATARHSQRRARAEYESASAAARLGHEYAVVAGHASAAARHRSEAAEVLQQARILARTARLPRPALAAAAGAATEVWDIPAAGRPRTLARTDRWEASVPNVKAWAKTAAVHDQAMINLRSIATSVQIKKNAEDSAIWPWTVRIVAFDSDDGAVPIPSRARQSLATLRFVGHEDSEPWCHVAPRTAARLTQWLTRVVHTLQRGE